MAVNTKHTAYGTVVASLTTELNSVTNGSDSGVSGAGAGAVLDNTTNLNMLVDIELVLAAQGSARSTGARIAVFFACSADGTNYEDASSGFGDPVATFFLDAATTARRRIVRDVPIPPGKVKCYINNGTGQTLAAASNIINLYPHSVATG